MNYTLQELSGLIPNAELTGQTEVCLTHVLYDSRKIFKASTGLFVAIPGDIHDGHHYAEEAYIKGVRNFLVSQLLDLPKDANQLIVTNTLNALQEVATFYRAKLQYPIIGITGSNGKTIVKEWLSTLLVASGWRVQKSPKSYNSQLGVALSVLDFEETADIGIVEAGISEKGEMIKLERIIKPTYGIFTNLGSAHSAGFLSEEEKFKEKIILFSESEKVIASTRYHIAQKQVSYGVGDVTYSIEKSNNTLIVNNNRFVLPFADDVSVENIVSCVVACLELGISSEVINEHLSLLTPIKMRLEIKEGINNCHIIDDSYSNDLVGIHTAFEFLAQQHFNVNRTLILSGVLQSSEGVYEEVRHLIQTYSFSKVYLIGVDIKILAQKEENYRWFESTEDFFNQITDEDFQDEVILVKGARQYGLERVVTMLQQKMHRAVFEVNLNAIAHNLNVYRAKLQPETRVMAMVKAFSYGAGDAEVAQLLEFQKVDYLAVAYADEGIKLRTSGVTLPIMVMNAPASDVYALHQYNLEPEVFTLTQVKEMAATQLPLKLHLKLDTGMHRLGFEQKELLKLLEVLHHNTQLEVISVFTHLSGTDEAQFDEFTTEQINRYNDVVTILEKSIKRPFIKHVLNSAGITRFPGYQYDMVRLGIGLYGVGATSDIQRALHHVGTLKTIVSQIKEVPKGETVGYSRQGKATEAKRIATIAIGYADGFDRRFSNGVGKVVIKGVEFSIIGNVCMDMCMVDITGYENIKTGDEVLVYGCNNTVQDMAALVGTIPYELLTSVGERVKRVYYLEE